MDKKAAEATLALGELALKFATTNRVTFWPDGETFESDTDHTVMVGLLACAFASAYEPSLDVGRVAQFALVHDLVEAYAGDTNTYRMTSDEHWKAKGEREKQALVQIKNEFSETLPWVPETIEAYESLASKEARFVKTLDKAMPKITRLLNHDAMHDNPAEFRKHCEHQLNTMKTTYGKDQQSAIELYEYLMAAVLEMLDAKEAARKN
jgi:5'-deoxynucleotidase YfbR-like HD superfamily hydrolase